MSPDPEQPSWAPLALGPGVQSTAAPDHPDTSPLPARGGPPNKSLGAGAVASPGYGFQALTQRGLR